MAGSGEQSAVPPAPGKRQGLRLTCGDGSGDWAVWGGGSLAETGSTSTDSRGLLLPLLLTPHPIVVSDLPPGACESPFAPSRVQQTAPSVQLAVGFPSKPPEGLWVQAVWL